MAIQQMGNNRLGDKLDALNLTVSSIQNSVTIVQLKQVELEARVNDHETRLRVQEKWMYVSLGVITVINFFGPFIREILTKIVK